MPEAINLGVSSGWLNDSNTEIKCLWNNTVTVGSWAMFDSGTNAAYTVPAGKKLTLLYLRASGITGIFYLHAYTGGVYTRTALKHYMNNNETVDMKIGIEIAAGEQVYVQVLGDQYITVMGVESTV
ncbi:MAG: hypothetical protein [Circular genetic element sp.]|nr:MAG: hypothetical protein [Circular genetic element sp.]